MAKVKRKKKARKGVTVKAWCVVDDRGKPMFDCNGSLMATRTLAQAISIVNEIADESVRRCRVIVG